VASFVSPVAVASGAVAAAPAPLTDWPRSGADGDDTDLRQRGQQPGDRSQQARDRRQRPWQRLERCSDGSPATMAPPADSRYLAPHIDLPCTEHIGGPVSEPTLTDTGVPSRLPEP
jgi:hypothetical protein